ATHLTLPLGGPLPLPPEGRRGVLETEMRAGMRRVIDREEAFGLDRSVALCRRQAGMAQEFLNGAQIAAASEEMGGETVAQRVRGRGFGQTEKTAQRRHLPLHDPGVERPAAATDKKRAVLGQQER